LFSAVNFFFQTTVERSCFFGPDNGVSDPREIQLLQPFMLLALTRSIAGALYLDCTKLPVQ